MHAKTAIVMLNLGGPVTLSHVEPFLKTLFGDRDLIKLPGPAWFQPTYAWGIAKIRTKGAQKNMLKLGEVLRFSEKQHAKHLPLEQSCEL